MYVILALFAALLALIVTGFGGFAAWAVLTGRHSEIRRSMSRWSVFDYVLLALFVVGTVFLLADVVGMLGARDSGGSYPYFHLGYLLSGFIYNTLAGVFLFVRLGLTIRLLGTTPPAAEDHHAEPNQAQRSK